MMIKEYNESRLYAAILALGLSFLVSCISPPPQQLKPEEKSLTHLESLAEEAATHVYGEAVDHNTPVIVQPFYMLLVRNRGTGKLSQSILEGKITSLDELGLKYIVDHTGEKFASALNHPAIPYISLTIQQYLRGDMHLQETKEKLKRLEKKLYQDLDMGFDDAQANAQLFDGFVFTYPLSTAIIRTSSGEKKPQICITADFFEQADSHLLVKSLIHELHHCEVIQKRIDNTTEERNVDNQEEILTMGEITAEIFSQEGFAHYQRKHEVKINSKQLEVTISRRRGDLKKLQQLYDNTDQPRTFSTSTLLYHRYGQGAAQGLRKTLSAAKERLGWRNFTSSLAKATKKEDILKIIQPP